LRFSWWCSTKL